MARKYNLTGETINNWLVGEYLGKSEYQCECIYCKSVRKINVYYLNNGKTPKCKGCQDNTLEHGLIDLRGKIFGTWEVIDYSGDRKWRCRCLCGCNTVKDVAGSDLRNGKSTGCGKKSNRKLEDLTGKRFGDWIVIEKGPTGKHGETQWLCECQCELKTRKLVNAYSLTSGASKSCGHATTGFKDLSGKRFGNWLVLGRVENHNNRTLWRCECQCKDRTIKILPASTLMGGISKSCGCLSKELTRQTSLARYGVNHPTQIGTTRTKQQMDIVSSKENLENFIKNLSKTPTTLELASMLGLDRASTMIYLHKYQIESLVNVGIQQSSSQEEELLKLFPTEYRNVRHILDGKELDLYYPEVGMAVEFNGNFWHSEFKRENTYHQNKSLLAKNKGIDIVHIFEYEWCDLDTKDKIINLLSNRLYSNKLERVYARNCDIRYVEASESREFLENNHLQGYTNASISLGLYYNNRLIGIMTFGTPRFNTEYQYELIRLAFDSKLNIIGGAEKLFSHFVNNYKPLSIISYCDIAKFSGKVYDRLGFKLDGITQPNYRWVGYDTYKVLDRYKTQKHILIENGLGHVDQSETEIMHSLGYYRVYDCGNMRFVWKSEVIA